MNDSSLSIPSIKVKIHFKTITNTQIFQLFLFPNHKIINQYVVNIDHDFKASFFCKNIFLLCLEYEQKCETKYEQKCETKYETQYEEQCETQYEEQCETKYDTQYEEKCETVSHDFNNKYTRYTSSSNHNIHKSSCGLCFSASDPLIIRFQ